jgi:hypothetical protein
MEPGLAMAQAMPGSIEQGEVLKATTVAEPWPSGQVAGADGPPTDQPPFTIVWSTLDGGGALGLGGGYELHGTVGQPEAFEMAGGVFTISGGYWLGSFGPGCYADCDLSGNFDINDFICFQTFFALGDPYADCDQDGQLLIDDFICFQTFYALGC